MISCLVLPPVPPRTWISHRSVVPSRQDLDRQLPPIPKHDEEWDPLNPPMLDSELFPRGIPEGPPEQIPSPPPQREGDRLTQPMPDVELHPLGVPEVPGIDPMRPLVPRPEMPQVPGVDR